ncbi:MAG TPA: Trm112 family protein [Allosphingosinicella sp.]|nr:Trm112 family protein [Allosphingosinicella sp.]
MTEELLALLVCPVTRTELRWDAERQELVSEAAGVAYPVRDGVPVMLIEEARVRHASEGWHPGG